MAEDQLRLFNRALECSSNGVVIVDLGHPWLPIIYANAAFERITGYGADEVVGKNCKLLQGDDTDQPEIETLRAAVKSGREATVTLRNYRKGGTMFWNKLSIAPVRLGDGAITHFIGIQSDVTDAKRAEQALAEHSARLDAVFAMSPDGFVLFEQPGRLVDVNRAFTGMTGLARTDLEGRSVDEFEDMVRERCDPQQAYCKVCALDDPAGAVSAAKAPPALIPLMRPERRILQRHVRLTDSGNEMVLYYRDITRETDVDRMKSEFPSTAAHELRTPMVSIYGFSEFLLKRKYPEERQKQFIDTIYRQTGRLVKMVNELLDLARIEARAGKDFKIEMLDPQPIVRETADALCLRDDPRTPEIDLPVDLPRVAVDAEKFRPTLMNVLSNAYKYSPRGSPVRIGGEQRVEGGRRQVGIAVEDHGMGMTAEQVARAFERFFRADESGNIPGTGLGLCLVKEIMELQGGSVELRSEFGKGTRIVLWAPAAEVAEALAA